jgi:protein regulator of cytokinesis 1
MPEERPKRKVSYISSQLESINAQLQGLYDDLGIPPDEREAREKDVYSVISSALELHVEQVRQERNQLRQRCEEIQKNLHDMSTALKDVDIAAVLGSMIDLLDVEIKPPYRDIEQQLERAFTELEAIYLKRSNRANELLGQLNDLSESMDGLIVSPELDPPSSKDDLDLSMKYLSQLETEIQRWRKEMQTRISQVSIIASDIVALWADLGTPQESLDMVILENYKTQPELIGYKLTDLDRLESIREALSNEKTHREERLSYLVRKVSMMWDKLSEDKVYVREFQASNRGLSLSVIEAYEAENARLQAEKRQHINLFINDAREQLKVLWERHYFSEEEKCAFTPAYADIFTDASLEAHEAEIIRLETLLEERGPILRLIEQFHDLKEEERQLEVSTQDASRLLQRGGGGKRDPTRLLREEKMRKRLAKHKPAVLRDLKRGLEEWERQTGQPFLIYGESFNDTLNAELAKVEAKRSVRKPISTLPDSLRNNNNKSNNGRMRMALTPRNRSPTKHHLFTSPRSHVLPPSSVQKWPANSPLGKTHTMARTPMSVPRMRSQRPAYLDTPLSKRSRKQESEQKYRQVLGDLGDIPSFMSGTFSHPTKQTIHDAAPSSPSKQRSLQQKAPPEETSNSAGRDGDVIQAANGTESSGSSRASNQSVMSHSTVSNATTASEEDSFDDPAYLKWRQEAVRKLDGGSVPAAAEAGVKEKFPKTTAGTLGKERLSAFDWDKDAF